MVAFLLREGPPSRTAQVHNGLGPGRLENTVGVAPP